MHVGVKMLITLVKRVGKPEKEIKILQRGGQGEARCSSRQRYALIHQKTAKQ